MKQIFDWLREQMQEELKKLRKMKKLCLSLCHREVLEIEEKAYNFYLNCINEAEAKWEADCCEQKWNKEDWWYDTSCGHILEPHSYNFCPYCGKRIKISEVE